MVEISGRPISQIFSAGIELVKKTIQEKWVYKGLQQLGPKFLDLCKTVSTSMSNSFSYISRNVKQSLESFFPKLSIASSEQKQIEHPVNKSENTEKTENCQVSNQSSQLKTQEGSLIDEAIAKLSEMGVKEGKSYKSGTLKLYFNPSNKTNLTEKEKYVKNHLVQQYLERGKISRETHNILKNQSLEHVLGLINGETLMMEKDGKEVSIRLDGKDLKLKDGGKEKDLKKNCSSLGQDFVNDIASMDWSRKEAKIYGQIPKIDTQKTIDKTFSNTTEACNEILKEIQKLPKNILSDATTAFDKKLNESQPTLEQFQRFYNNLNIFSKEVTTMEAFNSMLKSFDGK